MWYLKMKKLLVILSLCVACGGAIPAIIAGLSTAAQVIEYFSDVLKPQNEAAQEDCAQAIESLSINDPGITDVVEACDELTDAFLSVVSAVDQLRENEARGAKDAAAVEKAKQRIREYNESYKQYDATL